MWTTSEMPSTTPRQVTSQGRAPPACMAQLARRDSAELALLACTVVSDPPWPVLSACSRSAASPPRTSPTTMWSGRWRRECLHQVADRDGRLGTDGSRLEAQAVRALDPELERVLDGDDPLLLGEQLDQRVQQRGLARARASGHQDVPAGGRSTFAGGAEHGFRCPIPLARFIAGPPREAASSPSRVAGSGASGRRAGPEGTSCRRRAGRSPDSWRGG